MSMDFSTAERQNDFSEIIPQGTLSWGALKVRPYNLDAGLWETPSKSSEAKYLDCEVALVQGRFAGRKVWTRIGTAGSEKYINMGKSQIRAILETGKGANENNPAGYNIDSYGELNGLPVAIKIKEEPEQNGYPAKNDVAVFLSPVDPVSQKDYKRLEAGDTEPKGKQNVRSAAGAKGVGVATPAARWATAPGSPAIAAQAGAPATPLPVNPAAPPPWLVPTNPAPASAPPASNTPAPASAAQKPAPEHNPPATGAPTPPWATQ